MSLAPEFSSSLEWLNTPPVTLAAQRGRVVALVFFSAGSAYGSNVLEDLRFLQARHSDSLMVIGIHTPKFEAERQARLALKTINRLGVRFPVAHDPNFITWQHYGIRAWPTVVLLDLHGQVVHTVLGDLQRDALDKRINQILDQAGSADRVFDSVQAVSRPEPRQPLQFPMGLAATATHIYVADSGHHRVIECTPEGRILRQFGSGNAGNLDGAGGEAGFNSPRALWLTKDLLYVLDSGNHSLRRIKLLTGEVETLAGTGRVGDFSSVGKADPRQQAMNLPCDIVGSSDRLFIAMAGANQVWEYDMVQRKLSVLAGSGQLGLSDGPAHSASFAQPSGLALVQQTLYVADAASSAIRSFNLGSGQVQTLVGQGVFSFGNEDGSRASAMLQFPSGLALDPRAPLLWVVDSYNCCLRMLRLGGGEVRRFELDYRLSEPMGITVSQGSLYLSNTNAHEVLRIDPEAKSARRIPIGE